MRRWMSPTRDTHVPLEEKSSIQPLIAIASASVFQTLFPVYILQPQHECVSEQSPLSNCIVAAICLYWISTANPSNPQTIILANTVAVQN